MLYSVTVCTWYTHTHTYMHVTPLILTRHIQPVYADSHKIHTQSMALCADLCDTEFHPYWKNLTVRQKFIMSLSTPVTAPIHYVPQHTCHCTNFHKTYNNAIQFMDISCTIFYPNQEKPQTTGATFLLYQYPEEHGFHCSHCHCHKTHNSKLALHGNLLD